MYCSFCGNGLSSTNKDSNENKSKDNNRKITLIVIIVAVVAVIGAIGIRLFYTYSGKEIGKKNIAESNMTESINTISDEDKLDEIIDASDSSFSDRELSGSDSSKHGKDASELKVGFISLHDENSFSDKLFIDAAIQACEERGVECVIKTNVPESIECKDAAEELADYGCDIVVANSFGHEDFLIEAARAYPDVQFCHVSGTKAHTEKLNNFHNVYPAVYQASYLTGTIAGQAINDMIESGKIKKHEAVIGYVGTYCYAEVISDYTAFYLGAKSVCPSVSMKVIFTHSWYDESLEKAAAYDLVQRGAVLISEYSVSLGAPTACENMGVPNVPSGGSTEQFCPDTYLASFEINWQPYFSHIIDCELENQNIETDYVGDFNDGSLAIAKRKSTSPFGATYDPTQASFDNVFDTSKFTVHGETLKTYIADVDTDMNWEPDTEVVSGGYFHEQKYRSAPYFDVLIDGIELLNEAY